MPKVDVLKLKAVLDTVARLADGAASAPGAWAALSCLARAHDGPDPNGPNTVKEK